MAVTPELRKLRVIPPKTGEAANVEASADETGAALKQRVADALGISPENHVLLFQNGSRNAAKKPVEEAATLAAQNLDDGATITVQESDQYVQRDDSFLRQSIAKNGQTSYYYAHASEKELPIEHRYAYGGAPQKLEDEATVKDAASLVESAPVISIIKYAWADEGEVVKLYIGADGEPEAVEAAKDGKGSEVSASYGPRSVELKVRAGAEKGKDFCLLVKDLEHEIRPDECKFRVSAGKRITLTLQKKTAKPTWTRLVRSKV